MSGWQLSKSFLNFFRKARSKRSIERQIGQQVVLQSGLAIFTVGTLMFSVHRNLNLEIGDVYELKCDINIFWTRFVASGQMTHRAAQKMTIIIIFVRVLTATMGWNKHFVQNVSFLWNLKSFERPISRWGKGKNKECRHVWGPVVTKLWPIR